MATNRRIAIYVVAITAVLAVPCFLLWMSSFNPIYSNPWPWLGVDVRFREGYVNVTMTNNDNRDYIISEVILSRAQTILAGELLHEPIPRGEQFSICINFNWTSHALYEIIVRTTEGKSTLVGQWAP